MDDWGLWEKVRETIKPLIGTTTHSRALDKKKPAVHVPARSSYELPSLQPEPAPSRPLLPQPMDAQTFKKFKDRKFKPSEILDLHGQTRQQAYESFTLYIRTAQASGRRQLLVITGKGRTGQGIIRQELRAWMMSPEVSDMIISFAAAANAHGGEGAVYILVRKKNP